MDPFNLGSDIYFGKSKTLPDWRGSNLVDPDPDDEDVPASPVLAAVLGYDPNTIEWDDVTDTNDFFDVHPFYPEERVERKT
jgi:hypothetical protein